MSTKKLLAVVAVIATALTLVSCTSGGPGKDSQSVADGQRPPAKVLDDVGAKALGYQLTMRVNNNTGHTLTLKTFWEGQNPNNQGSPPWRQKPAASIPPGDTMSAVAYNLTYGVNITVVYVSDGQGCSKTKCWGGEVSLNAYDGWVGSNKSTVLTAITPLAATGSITKGTEDVYADFNVTWDGPPPSNQKP